MSNVKLECLYIFYQNDLCGNHLFHYMYYEQQHKHILGCANSADQDQTDPALGLTMLTHYAICYFYIESD